MAITLQYPIMTTHSNIVICHDKSVIAYYRIPNTPITITDDEKKEKHKQVVAQTINKLAKNKNFDISLIPKDYLLEEKMKDFSKALAPNNQELGETLLAYSVDKLTQEMEIPYQFDWVIGVTLRKQDNSGSLSDLAYERFSELSEIVANGIGYELQLDDNWYNDYLSDEAAIYQVLSSLRCQRLTDEELFYYQRMQYLRYIPHLKQEVIANRSLFNVTDTLIKVLKGGFLKLESPYGTSFVTILPVGKFSTIFNGFHLGEFIQRLNFPVELRIKGEFIDRNKIKGKMGRSNTRFLNIMEEADNTNTVQQDEIITGALSLKDLMKKVGNKEDIIEYGAYLIVSASSLTQLRSRRQVVLNYFDDMGVEISEASHDAPYLFQALLYGQKLQKKTRTWTHMVTTRGFAELMPFTNTTSGNRIGWYIGRVDNWTGRWDNLQKAIQASKNIVLFNPTVGNKENIAGKITKNPHIIITGATGQGKSFLAQIIFLSVALQNVKTLYIDPKRELRHHYQEIISNAEFAKQYPERKRQIESFNFVTLDSSLESNHGVLDPIVVLDKEQAVEVAKNMLEFLLQAVENVTMDQKTAITETINDIVNKRQAGQTVGFKHVLESLKNSEIDQIASVGRYLTSIVHNSILELAFSDGTTKGLNYESQVTVLEVANLKLPKSDASKISDHERNSVALMFALGAFCTHFGERHENEDTLEFFDEAWILMKSAEGQAVIKNMRRIGRSKNNTLALITQSVHDAENDDDTTGFGTIFAFYEKSEREDILKHVGLEPTEQNLEWIDNMISGQCLYYDVYGNLNMISVHNLFEDIDMLLKPMKATVSSSLENKYAS
ncbi:conjugative transposon protein [Streptococcus infantarius subsp. infantarius]|uniref:ATP-binding protein n=1 Tax=Streptococcus infantarius TaxID=102684 RepID=UPI00208E7AFE|nr:ATP-binding protein [Streptococcus infantarius]MCO4470980.1 conjugative transposon protein [Streptococcus infantarius subsp. infantarius]MCO4474644.1 conjugative transposon protein [Streptococcus infantarius subsp. infantarius]MCO4476603.1 conjugative transposon protein [Streptococcus infantarius subsp. infantarius]MCO4478675.1 conjugative transposon protein [Streptococcus infantarius subsp. infantarius]MCO4496622.1 conjugative transposon protein [Streptococcus infantarius subsp. infantariu